jgi:hypothetical protein
MNEPMDRRRVAGNTTSSLLLVLVVLLGVGAWNYYRNYQLERASEQGRPYSGYSTHEVELLRDAVAGELEANRARYARARGRRMRSPRDQGSVEDNARQFNRTARASDAIRDAAGDVAVQESLKAALDQELAARAGAGSGTSLHLKRLTTF